MSLMNEECISLNVLIFLQHRIVESIDKCFDEKKEKKK